MGCPHGDEPQRCAVCLRAQLQQANKRMAELWDALQQAQEELKPYAVGPLGEPAFKTKADAERALEQVEREYDEAIKRTEAAEALAKRLVARLNTVNSTAEQAKQLVGLIQDEVQDCLRGSAPAEALVQRGEGDA